MQATPTCHFENITKTRGAGLPNLLLGILYDPYTMSAANVIDRLSYMDHDRGILDARLQEPCMCNMEPIRFRHTRITPYDPSHI